MGQRSTKTAAIKSSVRTDEIQASGKGSEEKQSERLSNLEAESRPEEMSDWV